MAEVSVTMSSGQYRQIMIPFQSLDAPADINKLVPGERQGPLPESLVARIEAVRKTLEEVYPLSIEQWLDSFERDAAPEAEIEWWERMAQLYREAAGGPNTTLEQRQAVFKQLFALAMGSGTDDQA